MDAQSPSTSVPPPALDAVSAVLSDQVDGPVHLYEASAQQDEQALYVLARTGGAKKLVVAVSASAEVDGQAPFVPETTLQADATTVLVCPLTPENAQKLREHFPWTAPVPLGTASALGCGDRLGLATPGHLRAVRRGEARPVLAQQSIREMERTERSPQDVLDDATWAVFQDGFKDGFGADADHLKTPEHVDRCFDAGYTMYTIDPSDYVDNEADHLGAEALEERFQALPWEQLGTTPEELLQRYTRRPHAVNGSDRQVSFSEADFKRAAVKYGAAIAHTKKMADYVAARYRDDRPEESYDLEMSVDETDHPTRPREHFFVAAELERLGVKVTSLAPRFTGDFEKGIDFKGDLETFEDSFRQHAAIAEAFGGYKLSIHSGSDKFSVFPIMGKHAGTRLHLKTAGTSYLEALRIVARHAPAFFREIVQFAFERFDADRKTYHVSTDLDAIPTPDEVADADLEPTYLDDDDGRQLLHITYGSVLSEKGKGGEPRFRTPFFEVLEAEEEEHYETLRAHFVHHIESVGGAFAGDAAA